MARPRGRGAPLPRLRALRIARLLTQEQLAALAGVSAQTVLRLEREGARAELRTIARLAEALGVPPAELLRAEPAEPPAARARE